MAKYCNSCFWLQVQSKLILLFISVKSQLVFSDHNKQRSFYYYILYILQCSALVKWMWTIEADKQWGFQSQTLSQSQYSVSIFHCKQTMTTPSLVFSFEVYCLNLVTVPTSYCQMHHFIIVTIDFLWMRRPLQVLSLKPYFTLLKQVPEIQHSEPLKQKIFTDEHIHNKNTLAWTIEWTHITQQISNMCMSGLVISHSTQVRGINSSTQPWQH